MDELAKRFAELAEKYGPNVINAALDAARVEAYSSIASGAMWGVAGLLLLGLAAYLFKKIFMDEWDDFVVFPAILSGAVGILGICICVWTAVDPWTYTRVTNPELWIAKKVLKL